MVSVSASVEVEAEAGRLWATLVDAERYHEWLDLHDRFVGPPPGPLAPGVAFGQRVTVLGVAVDLRWRVADVAAPQRVALTGVGPAGIRLAAAYAVDTSTRPGRVEVSMTFTGLAVALVAGRLEAEVATRLRTSLDRFRAVVQG